MTGDLGNKPAWGSKKGFGFEDGAERAMAAGARAGSCVLGRPGAPATTEVRPGRPLASAPAAVATLGSGIRWAGARGVSVRQDVCSNHQILGASLLHRLRPSLLSKRENAQAQPDSRCCGSLGQ